MFLPSFVIFGQQNLTSIIHTYVTGAYKNDYMNLNQEKAKVLTDAAEEVSQAILNFSAIQSKYDDNVDGKRYWGSDRDFAATHPVPDLEKQNTRTLPYKQLKNNLTNTNTEIVSPEMEIGQRFKTSSSGQSNSVKETDDDFYFVGHDDLTGNENDFASLNPLHKDLRDSSIAVQAVDYQNNIVDELNKNEKTPTVNHKIKKRQNNNDSNVEAFSEQSNAKLSSEGDLHLHLRQCVEALNNVLVDESILNDFVKFCKDSREDESNNQYKRIRSSKNPGKFYYFLNLYAKITNDASFLAIGECGETCGIHVYLRYANDQEDRLYLSFDTNENIFRLEKSEGGSKSKLKKNTNIKDNLQRFVYRVLKGVIERFKLTSKLPENRNSTDVIVSLAANGKMMIRATSRDDEIYCTSEKPAIILKNKNQLCGEEKINVATPESAAKTPEIKAKSSENELSTPKSPESTPKIEAQIQPSVVLDQPQNDALLKVEEVSMKSSEGIQESDDQNLSKNKNPLLVMHIHQDEPESGRLPVLSAVENEGEAIGEEEENLQIIIKAPSQHGKCNADKEIGCNVTTSTSDGVGDDNAVNLPNNANQNFGTSIYAFLAFIPLLRNMIN